MEEETREQSHSLMDLDLEESGETEGVTDLNNKHPLNNYGVQVGVHHEGLRVSRRSPGKRKRRRASATKCFLITCVVVLLLTLIAVGIFLILYFAIPRGAQKQTEVQLDTAGLVRGRLVAAPGGGQVEQYLGIPYGKPPVGNLRYADPVPYGRYSNGVSEAYEYGASCLQALDTTFGDFLGSDMWNPKTPLSEDCLNLNVWVPYPRRKKRAVMVWIFGGGYYAGSGSLWVYDGKALAAQNDIILVAINYRLGSFGFLSTTDGRIKGNFGLKDQLLALRWVRENIEAFGGDPDYVTLFGESAGGASVGYHVLMPQSANLFRRATLQSGSSTAHWSTLTSEQARTRAKLLFDRVKCADDDAILDCLRQKDAKEILANEWVTTGFLDFPWAPTVDGEYIRDMPANLLDDGKFNQVDVMTGVNKDEGTYWLLYALPGFSKDNSSLHSYKMYLDGVDQVDFDLSESARQEIKEQYKPNDISDTGALRDALDDVAGDRSFICPVSDWSDRFRRAGMKTYFYYLTHRASNEVWPPWMGVIHGAEIQWVFGIPLNESWKYTKEEQDLSKKVMAYWTNFAKYGNPNQEGLPYWPQYSLREASYIELKSPSQFLIHKNSTHREKMCRLWNRIQQARVDAVGRKTPAAG